jgi:hypothetical protein
MTIGAGSSARTFGPEPEKAELIKLEPSEVLTTAEAAKLLNPLIKPLPSV